MVPAGTLAKVRGIMFRLMIKSGIYVMVRTTYHVCVKLADLRRSCVTLTDFVLKLTDSQILQIRHIHISEIPESVRLSVC